VTGTRYHEPSEAHRWIGAAIAALRAAGVRVTTGQAIACARALAAPGLDANDPWARVAVGRLTLVSDLASLRVYDEVVPRLIPRPESVLSAEPSPTAAEGGVDAAVDTSATHGPEGAEQDVLVAGRHAVEQERLRHRRFDRTTADERAAIDRAVRTIRLTPPRRPGRRRRPGPRGDLDLARTLERALQGTGELLEPSLQLRRRRPRPLVLVLDVSGSMAPVARTMLGLAVAARRSGQGADRRRVEVFAFGTRLTRLTDALDRRDPDAALAEAAARVVDWDGGTRIGASLDTLVRTWGPRGVVRGAVVVVCSDGLERGDPKALGAAAMRLRRRCHRLVWVTPLTGDPGFEPRQRGLAAALPAIDVLLPGHDLASIEELAGVIAGAGSGAAIAGVSHGRRRHRTGGAPVGPVGQAP